MHNPRNPHPLSFQGAKSPLGHHKSFESTSSMRDLQYRENRDTSVGPSMFPNKKGDFLGKKVLTPRPLHGQSVNSLYSEHPTRDITLSSSSSESKHSASFSLVLFTNPTSLFHVFLFFAFLHYFFCIELLLWTLTCLQSHTHTHTHRHVYTHTHTHKRKFKQSCSTSIVQIASIPDTIINHSHNYKSLTLLYITYTTRRIVHSI